MESLILMRSDFTQLAEITQYTSLTLGRSFWGVGAVSLTLHPKADGADSVQPGALLFLASQPQQVAILEDVTRTREKLTATGVQLKGIARRRIAVPPLNLPTRLWRYAGGQWTEVTDAAVIRQALQNGTVYQGFERPASAAAGSYWLDMKELGAVYDWGSALNTGSVVYDLGTAQLRSKYQNFGWDRFTGSAEDAYLHYAMNNLIAPEDPKRAIPGLTAETSRHRGKELPWQARFDKLTDVFADIGEATGLGWDIVPDYAAKRWRFVVLEGADRGAYGNTGGNAIALLSEEMGNAETVTRKQRTSACSTTLYIGGSGEDENRMIYSVGNEPEGLERRELWAEAGSVDDVDMLQLFGENKLATVAATDVLDADLMDRHGAVRYGVDYELGDIVGVAGAGAQMNARITEVNQTFEGGKQALKITFGTGALTVGGFLLNWARAATR